MSITLILFNIWREIREEITNNSAPKALCIFPLAYWRIFRAFYTVAGSGAFHFMLNKEPKNELAGGRRSNFSICRRPWQLPLCHRGSTQVISTGLVPSQPGAEYSARLGVLPASARGSEAGET